MNCASRTLAGLSTYSEDLFRVIRHKTGTDWVCSADHSISACHEMSFNASRLQWLKDSCHASVKKVSHCTPASSFVADVF
jgi:hypothetical protein